MVEERMLGPFFSAVQLAGVIYTELLLGGVSSN
jgi:hypothetical protein